MSIDVASLVFEFDSTSAAKAAAQMKKLIATGDRLAASAARFRADKPKPRPTNTSQ